MPNSTMIACRRFTIACLLLGPLLAACAEPPPRIPFFTAEVPEDVRSAPAEAYPNVNLAPDRPRRHKIRREVEELERRLAGLRDRHVREMEETIDRSGRSE